MTSRIGSTRLGHMSGQTVNRWRWVALAAGLGLLAACAEPPKRQPGVAPPPGPASAPEQTGYDASQGTGAGAPGTASAPVPQQSVQGVPAALISKTLTAAIEALEGGQDDQAETLLRQILQTEPGHRQASSLLKQIKDDPQQLYGRESFVYKVQPGESLSKIAQRFMNDAMQFYGLARYNGIKVPKQVGGGQTVRVPGKQPANLSSPNPPVAPPPVVQSPVAPPPPPSVNATSAADAALKAEREKKDAVARHTRAARASFQKQDLKGAVTAWDRVLELEPANRTATLERQKALDLIDKLDKLKKVN